MKVEVSRSAVARIRTEKEERQNRPLSKQELIKLAKVQDSVVPMGLNAFSNAPYGTG